MVRRDTSLSRHAEELIDFRWSVAADGHTVVEVAARDLFPTNRDALELPLGQRFARESDFEDRDELNIRERLIVERPQLDGVPSHTRRRIVPSPGAYVDFASLLLHDEAALVSFADTHGLLGRPTRFVVPDTARMADGEVLSTWYDEIRAMRASVVAHASAAEAPGVVPSWVNDATRRALQDDINRRMAEDVGPLARLLWDQPTERLVFRLVPRTLIGAMWLELARAIDAGTRYARCATCARFVSLHPDRALGKRTDARYCTPACRQRAWRARRNRAPEMVEQIGQA